ncbi:helix-turn-helix transcriptional regulator [Streptomyces althioticus]|uniref:helix-turn-helix transcriptional regulator n=1 Tax=Actinomycetes TaxID=1760 RepID=UPI00187647DC|nr:helix-turn-helix transcriptional regulator [Actinospica acidiphila]MBM4826897.1 helix-turn-helix transcriptional regulator [Actinospica acidiphila]GGQ55313.1 helix-turn-helix transcriptional regulator [Streptomyces althioticus]GGT40000.1 helix-turn-helix transcriptional regulator [Streptomyces matensis]
MTGHTTARQRLTAELLDALRTDGGVRVVTGEPGCGRTTFLDHAARLFRGGPVCHVRAGGVRELDEALRTAGPLLVCVDDADLWDAPSRAALARTAGRIRETAVRTTLLLTVANHRPPPPELADLPVLRLGPLTPGDAALLIRERADSAVDPAVREELIAAAEGNPALLLALLRSLSPDQLGGRRALPQPPAGGEVLADVAGDRLPDDSGGLLLTTAAAVRATGEEEADAALVLRAAHAAANAPLPDLLTRSEGRLRFRSALMAQAVYATASSEDRRAAHLALAEAATGQKGILPLLHRAWAVSAPAPTVAASLAAAAADPSSPAPPALRRRALTRAADLTPDEAERARRHLAAAEQALLAGHAADALRLLDRARGRSAPAAVRGGAELLRGAVLLADGPVEDARESFLLAADLLPPPAAARATLGAADAAWSAGDPTACLSALAPTHTPRTLPLAEACVRVPKQPGSQRLGGPPAARVGATAPRTACTQPTNPPPDGDPSRDHRDGMRAVLLARFDLAATPLRRVVENGLHGTDPDRLLRSAAAALMLGDVTSARRAGARALAAARTSGSAALEPRALEYLAYAELRAGRHQLARTHAEEGLRAAERAGQRNTAAHHHAVLALAASIEGEADLVAEHAEEALRTARRHGLAQAATLAHWAAARADLGAGRPREAAQRLGPLVRPGARRGHFAVWMLAVPCFVEAAASAGRPQHAAALVEDFALWAACGADPQAPSQLLRCRALLAGPDTADELYLSALDRHDDTVGDFERARTELLYGKWLRRRRRLREARTRLEEARLGFERCGAPLWAQQAAAELRAGGAAPNPAPAASSGAGDLARLTPQQLRIARYVAAGATNREVALSLSVSTRTVDYHLRNVFATLGLRSRVELVRLVEQEEKTGARL